MGMAAQNPYSAGAANQPMANTTNQMQQPSSMKGASQGSGASGGLKGMPQQYGNQGNSQGFNGISQGFNGWQNILAPGQPGEQGGISSYQFNPAQMPQQPNASNTRAAL
jgi:hypothetical protein